MAYRRLFQDEGATARAILRETLLQQDAATTTELWLLNEAFTEGTSLFDQFRAIPHAHAFDLNACSAADL